MTLSMPHRGRVSLLLGTAGDYGLTWDEPVYVDASDRVLTWLAALPGPGGLRAAFAPEVLRESWPFGIKKNRNLPVPVVVAHGLLAAATVVLVLLTALDVFGS